MVIARGVMKRLNTWVRDVVSLWVVRRCRKRVTRWPILIRILG